MSNATLLEISCHGSNAFVHIVRPIVHVVESCFIFCPFDIDGKVYLANIGSGTILKKRSRSTIAILVFEYELFVKLVLDIAC